jgi:hypothetical protein
MKKGIRLVVPIKASVIYNNPGLKFLEQKFVQNEAAKQQYKQRIKTIIDWSFNIKKAPSFPNLIRH